MTVVIESDCDVLVCIKYAIWLVLSNTYHFLTDDSLQFADKDQEESHAVAKKLYDALWNSIHIEIYSGIAQSSLR